MSCLKTGLDIMDIIKNKLDTFLNPPPINSKWIKNLNMKNETIKYIDF